MKSRREQRTMVIENLYACDMNDSREVRITEYAFVDEMLKGIFEHMSVIDTLISDHLERWSLKRLSFVDRAILRLAVYEMYATSTPSEIIINEALNLTRTFTDEGNSKAVAFNNSVLDKIRKTLKK